MPNWCVNRLSISAETEEEIGRFLDDVKGDETPFDFDKLVPAPSVYPEGTDCEDWSVQTWGTKWNTDKYNVSIGHDVTHAEIFMLTAWSPPIPVIRAAMKKFPELDFHLMYCEPGVVFAGEFGNDGEFCCEGGNDYMRIAHELDCIAA